MSASSILEAIQQAIEESQPSIRIIKPRRLREITASEAVARKLPRALQTQRR